MGDKVEEGVKNIQKMGDVIYGRPLYSNSTSIHIFFLIFYFIFSLLFSGQIVEWVC